MTLIRSIDDVEKNAFVLLDEIYSTGPDRDAALKLVKGGRVFYPIHFREQLAFAPSKFIGYLNNSVERHESIKHKERRDGRETNEAISKIMGSPKEDDELKKRLHAYCHSIGVELENHKHKFWRIESAKRFTAPTSSAINDIESLESGNDDPEYKRRMAGSYTRIQAVRREVLKRANGKCEFCGREGFLDRHGVPFLETHHIIALSEEGPDKPTNVIALCPNDHRQAHFGKDWKALQKQFKTILKAHKN